MICAVQENRSVELDGPALQFAGGSLLRSCSSLVMRLVAAIDSECKGTCKDKIVVSTHAWVEAILASLNFTSIAPVLGRATHKLLVFLLPTKYKEEVVIRVVSNVIQGVRVPYYTYYLEE